MTADGCAPAPPRPTRRALLLIGTSLGGLTAGPALAGPAPFSSGWYALKAAAGPAASAAIANQAAGAGMSSRTYAQVRQSLANLQHSAAAIAAMHAMQAQAHALAGPTVVPDGLQVGGIVPDSGLAANGLAAPVATWTGAAGPVQTGPASRPIVTVRQTAPSAMLNWRTLNVGQHTTLAFDQSAGGAAAPTWVALNRVNDPSLMPTQILGNVTAQGHVIVVNGSGIIFAPGAQVTVGSLIASTAAISNAQFAADGIYSADSKTPTFTGATAPVVVDPGAEITTNQPITATSAGGGVILLGSSVTNAGDIQTPDGQTILAAGKDFILQQGYGVSASGQSYGGVSNALVGNLAGTAGFGPGGTIVETVQGTAAAVADGGGAVANSGLIEATTGDVTLVGETVIQAGAIAATTSVSTRGTIHLLTDQTDTKSSVTLAPGSVTTILPDPDSNTALDAQRATDVANSSNADLLRALGGALPLNDQPNLPDNQYQSLIQIVSGHSVDVGAGALAMSQGGQIQIDAPGRVLVEAGADLDVSGTVGVSLPMSANQVAVNVQGFELRDNALNRDTTLLNNDNVTLDTRTLVSVPGSDAYANSPYAADTQARLYSPSGLFEVSGEVSNIAHTIGQWSSAGGTILVSGGASGQLVAEPGSSFNLAGGSIDYQAGALKLTWLIGPSGQLYDAATAPGDLVYTGVYNGVTFTHPRWNISQTYDSPLIAPASVELPGYVEGRDGGVLEISEPTVVLNGTVSAGAIDGPQQTQPRIAATGDDPYLQPQNAVPLPGQILLGNYGGQGYGALGIRGGYDTDVVLQASAEPLQAGFDLATPLPSTTLDTAILDTTALDASGLGGISVATTGSITVAAPLTLAQGGNIALNAPIVSVDADITARSGSISLGDVLSGPNLNPPGQGGFALTPTATTKGVTAQTETASVTVATGVRIDLRGQWTNLLLDPVDVTGEAASNGGTLGIDTTGAITLGTGSLIDVSSGAVVSRNGGLSGGVGGSATLIGDDPTGNPGYDALTTAARLADPALSAAATLPVVLAGTIRDENLSGNGGSNLSSVNALTLRAPGVLIASSAPPGDLDQSGRTVLTPSFFQAGFSNYIIDGYGNLPLPAGSKGSAASGTASTLPGVEMVPGVAVDAVVPVYLTTASSLLTPTGSDPETAASLYLPPAYLQDQNTATLTARQGANVTLYSRTFSPELVAGSSIVPLDGGGAIAIDQGASVTVDAGRSVTLEAVGQITVDGDITAPGGSITLQNDTYEPGAGAQLSAVYDPDLSVWIGSRAVLNASGVAPNATDVFGNPYGLAPAGGTIVIGGNPTVVGSGASAFAESTDATVVVRPGALIDASGSAATTDLSAGQGATATAAIVPLAGNGGSISLNSSSGIVLDGTLRAIAGGPTAAGGSLEIDLVTPTYGVTPGNVPTFAGTLPDALRIQREVIISQQQPASLFAAGLKPGMNLDAALGNVRVGADQIEAGGFANLTIAGGDFAGFGPTDVRFDGSVTLSSAESISLPAVLTDTSADATVAIRAPYVTLNGNEAVDAFNPSPSLQSVDNIINAAAAINAGVSSTKNTSALLIDADQLSIGNGELQGVDVIASLNPVNGETPTTTFDEPGFDTAAFTSSGDTRVDGTFVGGRSLTLTAAQLYPVSNSTLAVTLDTGSADGGVGPGTLTIERTPGTDPAPPLIVGNSLALIAGDLEQGGIVRAPLGVINLGYYNSSVSNGGSGTFQVPTLPAFLPAGATDRIAFLPGSVTSVSIAGQTILDGGTPDGVTYSGTTSFTPAIITASPSVVVDQGATLDLRGGGMLAGAGFNSGRGGSTDALAAPFLQIAASAATLPDDAVYSIVPGFTGPTQAPPTLAYPYASNVSPPEGEQVSIGSGVPGLAAGTYMLQPAYDALLPGAYRVEIEANISPLAGNTGPVGNLSTLIAGRIGIAGTSVLGTQPVGLLLTSGANVRRLSSYDEETPSQFTLSQAALLDQTRPFIVADAGSLVLDYDVAPQNAAPALPALSVAGDVLFEPGDGGRGGTVDVVTTSSDTATAFANIDIVGDAPGAGTQLGGSQYPSDTVVLRASDLDRLSPEVLSIGASTDVSGISFSSQASSAVEVEAGATLSAPQVFLLAGNGVTLTNGASLDTLAYGIPDDQIAIPMPYADNGTAVLVASNASLGFSPPARSIGGFADAISIASGAALLSRGTVAIDTPGSVSVGDGATLGTSRLYLAVSSVNVAPASGLPMGAVAPSGIDLPQTVLARLTEGGVVPGTPPLQQITVVASNSVNFFGTAGLSLAGNGVLEFDTPSIYGDGAAGDAATISAGTFIWNGIAQLTTNTSIPAGYVSGEPAGVLGNGPGTGSGSLAVDANTIILGYAPGVVPFTPAALPATGAPVLQRNTYGFGSVTLAASDQVIANNHGTLSVYRSQGAYANGGFANSGGNLAIVTPLLTAASGAVLQVSVGGAINMSSPGGAAGAAGGLGGEIDLTGQSIGISNTVVLPEGKLALAAGNDIALTGASIDLAGVTTRFFDQNVAGPGGTLTAESTAGSITADAASTIDISSPGAPAGTIDVTATAGRVTLANGFGAGGAPAGSIDVRAGTLTNFSGLNQRLTAGGLTGSRSFEIGSGDLTIASTDLVRASTVDLSLDSGSLTVDGLIDASGAAPGSISLSAGGNLVLTPNAVLDAHGTVPQTDSLGHTIDAENTGSVTLRVADGPDGANLAATGGSGTLTIASGAAIDVSAPAGVTCALGSCGTVEIDVPRLGAADGTHGDLAISAPGPISVAGAGSIAVDGFWSYAPADGVVVQTNTGANADPNGIGLDQIDAANRAFIGSALPNGALNATLAAKLAGLTSYASAFHLRPGVEIDSSAASQGDLTIPGDLDLSGLRYASLNPSTKLTTTYGSGEPGVLIVRASNDLSVYGSITDGFAPPVDSAANQNPDDSGWQLYSSAFGGIPAPLDQNVIVPSTASPIDIGGSSFAIQNVVLNYDLPVADDQSLAPGTTLPTSITLHDQLAVPQGGVVAEADVIAPDAKTILYAKGSLIPGGTMLAAGTSLDAGFLLFTPAGQSGVSQGIALAGTNALTGQQQVWPAGANLDAFDNTAGTIQLGPSVPLTAGDLIPGGANLAGGGSATTLNFADGSSMVALRPTVALVDGLTGQGQIYGAANLLPPGSLSWSISLVGGAATTAADPASLTPASVLAANGQAGNLTLSDLHYQQLTAGGLATPLASFSVIRTGTGALSLLAGGTLDEASTYGIYTAGTQSPGVIGTGFDQKSSLYPGGDPTVTSDASAAAVYQAIDASYPQGGGNVVVASQGSLVTTSLAQVAYYSGGAATYASVVGQWLQRQGDGSAGDPGAWSINFGNYTPVLGSSASGPAATLPILTGFTGIGTLGGGNLTVSASSAGLSETISSLDAQLAEFINDQSFIDSAGFTHATALDLAVGSTGRETAGGLVLTGGGRLTLDIANELDPVSYYNPGIPTAESTILDLRGNATIEAGQVSFVNGSTGLGSPTVNPYTATPGNGPDIVLGDASAQVYTRGDLSLGQTSDPGLQPAVATSANGGTTWFTLWQPTTATNLFSAGGDVAPAYVASAADTITTPTLDAVAASGNIYALHDNNATGDTILETAPSAVGELEFLAAGSIVGGSSYPSSTTAITPGPIISMSGADPSLLPTVANPAFTGESGSNPSNSSATPGTLFAFSTDQPTGFLHVADPQPARFYAVNGDVEALSTGVYNPTGSQVIAAKPVRIIAGDDIVGLDRTATSGLLWQNTPGDISVVSAGNNIYYANAEVAGPGLLEVSAGGNIDQTDLGTPGAPDPSTLVSLGYLVDKTVATQEAGAGITVTAGVPAGAINLAGFAQLYFNPANLADATTPLQDQPGKVVRTYQDQLFAFLQQRGYAGGASGALAAFLALPANVQQILVLQVYYAELNQSGLDYANPSSRFFRSYLEGTEAIRTLFPATDITGQSAASGGSLTLTGDSGINTDFGGAIEIADPFGATTIGVPGPIPTAIPGSTPGIITQGSGDVDIYSYGSVLLGQSRIFTTFGGNLLIWLEGNGEINGGQGSKSTIVFTPPNITYDPFADISLSPTVPSTGAGLATLAPVASVLAGNINLISPFGTIDAGEAGIRSSGNINLVALTILNAANVQAGGKVTGVPVAAVPNAAAITAASAVAGAAQDAAQNNIKPAAAQRTPSIITVEVVGTGEPPAGGGGGDDRKRKRDARRG